MILNGTSRKNCINCGKQIERKEITEKKAFNWITNYDPIKKKWSFEFICIGCYKLVN
jgi:rRNA maturation endonuclease Nob1